MTVPAPELDSVSPATPTPALAGVPAVKFYRIGTTKLAALNFCTLGVYNVIWFSIQWGHWKAATGEKLSPGLRGVFGVIYAQPLFKRVKETLEADGDTPEFNPALLALLLFALVSVSRLPAPYWLFTLFSFVPAQIVQRDINRNARKHDRYAELNESWEWWSFLLASIGAVILLLAIVGSFLPEARK